MVNKYCKCGCGAIVKNKFISGHNSRLMTQGTKNKKKLSMEKKWKDPQSKLNSIERKQKLSKWFIKNNPMKDDNTRLNRKGNKNPSKRAKVRKAIREKKLIRNKKQAKNGLPSFTEIGKGETSALNNLEKCFGYKILRQYKIKKTHFVLDGYCPMLKLAIEVDGPSHEKTISYDNNREKIIKEKIGCTFLRVKIPIKLYRGW